MLRREAAATLRRAATVAHNAAIPRTLASVVPVASSSSSSSSFFPYHVISTSSHFAAFSSSATRSYDIPATALAPSALDKQAQKERRQAILAASPPPPYKSRTAIVSEIEEYLKEVETAPSQQYQDQDSPRPLVRRLEAPMHTCPESEQKEVPEGYYWSHLPDTRLWLATSLNDHKPGYLGKHRYFLSNKDNVKKLVDSIGLEEISRQNGGEKITVVEAFPGGGTITSELLRRSEVGKVIALENEEAYLPWIKGLKDDPTVVDDHGVHAKDKLTIVEKNGYSWETYDAMNEEGTLSHLKLGEEKTLAEATKFAPLVFVAQLANSVHGDQLLAQFAVAAALEQWLFRYGKMKLVVVCPSSTATRLMAPAGSRLRSRLGTLLSMIHESKISLPHEANFFPQPNHVFPPNVSPGKRSLFTTTIPNEQFGSATPFEELCVYEMYPKNSRIRGWRKAKGIEDKEDPSLEASEEDEPIGLMGDEFEALEYLLRNLFVSRSKTVRAALETTYPGASGILNKLTPEAIEESISRNPALAAQRLVSVPDTVRVSDLTNAQWLSLAHIFEKWPFRPKYLFETSLAEHRPSKKIDLSHLSLLKGKNKVYPITSMGLDQEM